MRDIAFNVLLSFGYGISQPWLKNTVEKPPPGYELTYLECISLLVKMPLIGYLIPDWVIRLPIWPPPLKKIASALREFPMHTNQVLEQERRSLNPSKGNLLSTLINASVDKNATRQDSKSALYLSEEEIMGNLIIFTGAGFDTTANTLAYAVALLAVYPDWQQWITEEIDQVTSSNAEAEYEKIFPALKRCLAVMVSPKPFNNTV
jgi:cytochrome P450